MTVALADNLHCTGCAACVAVCSCDAITMAEDEEGFAVPRIDVKKCINCGLCERTCPLSNSRMHDSLPVCYAAKSNDANLVKNSSSGGVFSELAQRVIADGGVVYGAAYVGDDLEVKHIRVDSIDGLALLRGSKYVYSETNNIYRSVKKDLERRKVLFSGTPCQIAGLKAFLKKDYACLLAVEVICHGTPPARLFNVLKQEMANRHGRLTAISFRDKDEGWGPRAITGWYESGVKIRETGNLNDYFKAFIAHLSLRHSCEDCAFTNGRSGADITLGDFWCVTRTIPELNDKTGVSAVILHSEKGKSAFAELNCYKKKVALSAITYGNPSYQAPRKAERNRNAFMAMVYKDGISAAYGKCYCIRRPTLMRRVFNKFKRLLLK